jgi:O-methyltransferase domain
LRTLLTAHPRLRGTLFDLPRVVAAAKPAERLTIAAGDFSAEPLPRGDAYVLSQILHGYADDGAGGSSAGVSRPATPELGSSSSSS